MPLKKGVKCRTRPKKDGGKYTICYKDKKKKDDDDDDKPIKFKKKPPQRHRLNQRHHLNQRHPLNQRHRMEPGLALTHFLGVRKMWK